MKYTYAAILVKENAGASFCFYNLPSGILSLEEGEDVLSAMQDTLMDLLEDEDFLPHDSLPSYQHPEEKELKDFVEKVFSVPYLKENVQVIDVTVSEEEV